MPNLRYRVYGSALATECEVLFSHTDQAGGDMISVIIPCYNAAKYVAETISSVKGQTVSNWECIVVDDGSTDGSGEIIDRLTEGDPRFRVVHAENRGVAAARNHAISLASGEHILPLDADDRLVPVALERFAEAWSENPMASLIVPQIRRFSEKDRVGVVQERTWFGYNDLKIRCTPTNSSSFKKSDWERVGGYRDGLMYEDWEFWLRLLYCNDRVINIPEVLVEYRIHTDSRWHQAVKDHDGEIRKMISINPIIYGRKR